MKQANLYISFSLNHALQQAVFLPDTRQHVVRVLLQPFWWIIVVIWIDGLVLPPLLTSAWLVRSGRQRETEGQGHVVTVVEPDMMKAKSASMATSNYAFTTGERDSICFSGSNSCLFLVFSSHASFSCARQTVGCAPDTGVRVSDTLCIKRFPISADLPFDQFLCLGSSTQDGAREASLWIHFRSYFSAVIDPAAPAVALFMSFISMLPPIHLFCNT